MCFFAYVSCILDERTAHPPVSALRLLVPISYMI